MEHDGERVFFCHIAKTAGTSLVSLLKNHYSPGEVYPHYTWNEVQADGALPDGRGYMLYRGHFHYHLFMGLIGEPATVITMLREPISRVLSAYNHSISNPPPGFEELTNGKDITLAEYIDLPYKSPTRNIATLYLSAPPFPNADPDEIASYLHEIGTQPERFTSLERAKETLDSIAVVGTKEAFGQSLQLLSYKLGWRHTEQPYYQNVGRYGDFEPRQADTDRLHELNQLDMELYAYAQARFRRDYEAMVRDLLWYRYVTEPRDLPAGETVEIAFDHPFEGDGWYEPEYDESGQAFRWMGRETWATLYFVAPRADVVTIDVYLHHVIDRGTLDALEIRVNSERMPFKYVRAEDGQTLLRIAVPA
ncbi:MAG: sulfotransferase family 2 domain-containing protein, partial [Chloroflexota bacterium]